MKLRAKKIKMIIVVLLVGIMLSQVACVRDNSFGEVTTKPLDIATIERPELSPNNPVTITMWIVSSHPAPNLDNKISELLLERLGVTIEYYVVDSDVMHRSIGPRLARGDFLDLMGGIDRELRLLRGGALIRLDDYLDTGLWPNLLEHVKPYRGRLTYQGDDVKSGIYIIPSLNRFYGEPIPTTHWGAAFWIQKSVLSYLGYPNLSNMTLERYFDMIEEYMRSHPEINGNGTIGFTFPTLDADGWDMANPPMFLQGSTNTGNVIIDDYFNLEIYADSEYARRYFEILNQANARGLLYPNTFDQSFTSYIEILSRGNVLGMYDQRGVFRDAHDKLVLSEQWERTWVAVMPTFDNHQPNYAERPLLLHNRGFGISTSAEKPELLLTFLDTMLSEEWQIILSWGIEGEDFYVDENGMFYRTPQQRRNRSDDDWRAANRLDALLDLLPKRQGRLSCGNAFLPSEQQGEFWATLSAFDRAFLTSYSKSNWQEFLNEIPENPSYHPVWWLDIGTNIDAHDARRELTRLTEEWVPLLIMSDPTEFDELWEEYVAEIQEINIPAFLDALHQALMKHIELHGD